MIECCCNKAINGDSKCSWFPSTTNDCTSVTDPLSNVCVATLCVPVSQVSLCIQVLWGEQDIVTESSSLKSDSILHLNNSHQQLNSFAFVQLTLHFNVLLFWFIWFQFLWAHRFHQWLCDLSNLCWALMLWTKLHITRLNRNSLSFLTAVWLQLSMSHHNPWKELLSIQAPEHEADEGGVLWGLMEMMMRNPGAVGGWQHQHEGSVWEHIIIHKGNQSECLTLWLERRSPSS